MIRLDGDLYQSTWEALENLYPLVHDGGFVVVDDYPQWSGCMHAVLDFKKSVGDNNKIVPTYFAPVENKRCGIWWKKDSKNIFASKPKETV